VTRGLGHHLLAFVCQFLDNFNSALFKTAVEFAIIFHYFIREYKFGGEKSLICFMIL
jgi:hypothetical protein